MTGLPGGTPGNPSGSSATNPLLRIARLCGMGTILIGISGLLGWMFNIPALTSFIPGDEPIAISTSIVLMILGGVLGLMARPRLPRRLGITLLGLAVVITLFGLLEVIKLATGVDVSLENAILRHYPALLNNPNAHISPVTGVLVLLIGLAQTLFLSHQLFRMRGRAVHHVVGLIGGLVMVGSAVFVLGYLYGTPLLYGSAFIPIAAPTALGILLLGIGLVTLVGGDALPLSWFAGASTRAKLLRAFLPLTALVLLLLSLAQFFLTRLTPVNPAIAAASLIIFFEIIIGTVILQVARVMGNLIDQTETGRRRAEDELRASEKDLNRAQAVAKTGSWHLDVRRNALVWSDETYKLFGIPRGAPLTYEAFLAAVYPDDRQYVDHKWHAALQGEPYDIEHRIVVDSTVKWVRERAEMEFDDTGALRGGFGTIQDITERKHAEEVMRAREELLNIFIEHSPAAVAMFDRDMRYLAVSRRWLTDYHLGERNLLGLSHYEVFPEIGDEWKAIHQRCLAGASARRDEDRFVRADGTVDWLRWEIVPWCQPDGSIGGIIMFTEVITEHKRAEEEIKRERAFLASAIELLPFPVIFFTSNRQVLRMNRAGQRFLDLIGGMWREMPLLFPETKTPVPLEEQPITRALQGEIVSATERTVEIPGGDYLPVLMSAAPISLDGTLVAVVLTIQDIRELKEADRAKNQFLMLLSHELKTPLTSIIGWGQLARDDPAMMTEALAVILRNAYEQRDLLQRLIILSQMLTGKLTLRFARGDLWPLMASVIEETRTYADEHQITVTHVAPEEAMPVMVDHQLMRHAVREVLDNALHFTTAGGVVTVSGRKQDDMAILTISDTGRGIAPEQLSRLAKPFEQLQRDEALGGMGIGLALARGIVERHGGQITIASPGVGCGSTVTITLPLEGDV